MAGNVLTLILAVAVAILVGRLLHERRRRKELQLTATWPIASISWEELDPAFVAGPFGPSLDTEVTFIGRGPFTVPAGTSDVEAWILAVLAKRAVRMFEFGTGTGKTAYLWSRNAIEGAQVVTLTLSPTQHGDYLPAAGDAEIDMRHALGASRFAEFVYSGTSAADAITQLYGDSKQFDDTPYHNWADLIFVDGSHARSYVESDSQKAMRMIRPGGLVLWHDYAGDTHAPGVFRALNQLATSIALRHVRHTTLVAWRRPA